MDDVRAVMDAVGSERAALLRALRGRADERAVRRHLSGADGGAGPLRHYARRHLGARLTLGPDAAMARGSHASRRARAGAGPWPRDARAERCRRRASPRWWARLLRARREPGRPRWRCMRMNAEIDVRDVLPSIRVPTLVLHRTATDSSRSRPAGTWPSTSPAPGSSCCPGADHIPFVGDADAIARRDRGVPHRRPPRPRARSRARDRDVHRHRRLDRARGRARRPPLARAARGATTTLVRASSRASGAARSTPPATASSPPSTGRRGRSAAPARSRQRPRARHRGAGGAAHRASASSWATRSAASRSTSAPASRRARRAGRGAGLEHRQGPGRRLRASRSRIAGRTSSRASRTSGGSSRSSRKAGASEAPLRLLRRLDRRPVYAEAAGRRRGARSPGARARLRRRVHRADGRGRRRPGRRRRGDRRHPEGSPARVAHAGLTELHVVGACTSARRSWPSSLTLRRAAGRPRHARGEFEILTWAQLGIHRKPVGLLDVDGYWDGLLTLLGHARAEGSSDPRPPLLLSAPTPSSLLDTCHVGSRPAPRVWLDETET